MKECTKCKCIKPFSEFYKKPDGKFGLKSECKLCTSDYEKQRWAKNKENYVYSDERKEYRRKHYLDNKEKVLLQSSLWAKNNSDKKRFYSAKRKAMILQATPAWSDMVAVRKIYKEADQMTKDNGIKYEVDHIIPLQGRNVCGLHCENNLQIITMQKNREKFINYEE